VRGTWLELTRSADSCPVAFFVVAGASTFFSTTFLFFFFFFFELAPPSSASSPSSSSPPSAASRVATGTAGVDSDSATGAVEADCCFLAAA
jgi:hypothetical protein